MPGVGGTGGLGWGWAGAKEVAKPELTARRLAYASKSRTNAGRLSRFDVKWSRIRRMANSGLTPAATRP